MCVEIPKVRVGEPQACGGVAVFPLFAECSLFPHGTLDYVLASEVMAAETLTVREVSEIGEVPCLLVDNGGSQPVLFVEGEEVRGGKQNRILASSVLVAGRSRTRVPVACVERKRWEGSSPLLKAGPCCPPSVRHLLKEEANGRQSRIWQTIRRKHRATATRSATENMSDAMETRRDAVEDLRRNLPYPEGASGIAVALGGRVVGIDIFDKPATLSKLWDRLVQGVAIDALEAPDMAFQASGADVAVKLYTLKSVRWQRSGSVGLGEAYRGRTDDDILATALVTGDILVHLGMSMPT